MVLHCGMHCYRSEGWPKKVTPWFEFTGLPSTGHGAQAPIAVTLLDKDSPITRALQDWTTINEELYNNVRRQASGHGPALARGKQTFNDKQGKKTGRFRHGLDEHLQRQDAGLRHDAGAQQRHCGDARYLDLVTRGLLWSVGKLDAAHLKPAKKVFIGE